MTVQAVMMGNRVSRAAVQPISILGLLDWAFRAECAQLDFDNLGSRACGYGYASSTAAILQHEQLGCRVDGGGRGMAIQIAELARAGMVPDWMPDAMPRVVPVDTHTNRHGVHAVTLDAARLGAGGWPAQPRRNRKGVIVQDVVKFCPVAIRPSAADIARARRVYLGWYGALLELRETFRVYGGLSAWAVGETMPPRTPWMKNC